MGSSPLTRGKPSWWAGELARRGLIPAHAGKTLSSDTHHNLPRAHPRSRGENEALAASDATDKGSSPLTRGKPSLYLPLPSLSVAHPRSRGENDRWLATSSRSQGSSPLTRGKPWPARYGHRGSGLIPAHAGKTSISRRSRARMRAHPRSRGENPLTGRCPASGVGSSPLTRGKPELVVARPVDERLIPAHAGKTYRDPMGRRVYWAHPRSRGENHTGRWAGRGLQGSSPLTRGKLGAPIGVGNGTRLIPAHAGKTL